MIQNFFLRQIAVLLLIISCPIIFLGQDQRIADNHAGIYLESPLAGTGKMEVQENRAFQAGMVMTKDVEITLVVDVQAIRDIENADEETIMKYCKLSDDNKGSGSNVKNFKSVVFKGRSVKWKVKSKNKGTVKLLMVTVNPNNPVLFEEGYILQPKKGKMAGHIKNIVSLDTIESNYTIYFKIKKFLGTFGTYRLDPKLQANTR